MTGDVGTGQPLYVLRYDEQQIDREISKSEEVMGIVNKVIGWRNSRYTDALTLHAYKALNMTAKR